MVREISFQAGWSILDELGCQDGLGEQEFVTQEFGTLLGITVILSKEGLGLIWGGFNLPGFIRVPHGQVLRKGGKNPQI